MKDLFVSVLIQNLVSVRMCETYINTKGLIETAFFVTESQLSGRAYKARETRLKTESDTIHKHNNFHWCREI